MIPGDQNEISVASDGKIYFATWLDLRSGQAAVFGSRVIAAGVNLDPAGIQIAIGTSPDPVPSAVFDGANFAVIWRTAPGEFWSHVPPAGVVLEPNGVLIGPGNNSNGFAWDPAGHGLLISNVIDTSPAFNSYRERARLLDPGGPGGPSSSCNVASDCASGLCADGVCCDQACNGRIWTARTGCQATTSPLPFPLVWIALGWASARIKRKIDGTNKFLLKF